jgi:hypothetical protein
MSRLLRVFVLPLVLGLSSGCATLTERAAAGSAIGSGVALSLGGLAVGAVSAGPEGQLESRASAAMLGTGAVLLAAGVVYAVLVAEPEAP